MLALGHFVVLQGCLFCPALLMIISLLIRVFVDFAEGLCGRGHGRLSPHVHSALQQLVHISRDVEIIHTKRKSERDVFSQNCIGARRVETDLCL